jgi:hypothetical protein
MARSLLFEPSMNKEDSRAIMDALSSGKILQTTQHTSLQSPAALRFDSSEECCPNRLRGSQ